MSTIIASNISDGTTSVPSTYVVNGSAKAWVNFNGTGTVAIRESLNTTSITDGGTGLYWQNFTSSMSTTTYNVIASTHWRGIVNSDAWETGRVYFLGADTSTNSPSDRSYIFTAVWGDLA